MFNLASKFEVTGSMLNAPKESCPRTVCSPENKDIVAAAFLHSPKKSICQASKRAEHFLNLTLPYHSTMT